MRTQTEQIKCYTVIFIKQITATTNLIFNSICSGILTIGIAKDFTAISELHLFLRIIEIKHFLFLYSIIGDVLNFWFTESIIPTSVITI